MSLSAWWEENPERLEWEYAWLDYEGYEYEEVNRDDSSGTLELQVKFPVANKLLNLQVIFPPFYPDARCEVRCAELDLAHHQNPFTKELCLLGRATELWDPDTSLAAYLKERIPMVLIAGATEEKSKADPLEEHQAEPHAVFLEYVGESELLVDECVSPGVDTSGDLTAHLAAGKLKDGVFVRGVISSLNGASLWTPPSELIRPLFGWEKTISGRWFRLKRFPAGRGAPQFIEAAQQEHPEVGQAEPSNLFEVDHYNCELLVFEVPSEVEHRGLGTEWVAVLRIIPNFGAKKTRQPRYGFVRVERFGRDLIYQRAPELRPLSVKSVAVVGLGCIGSPAAVEFARAGIGELRILDPDIVETGTTVRWPLGVQAVGSHKVVALGRFIAQSYPLTKLRFYGSEADCIVAKVGGIVADGGVTLDRMRKFLDGVDLILDATAEPGVSSILSHLAGELQIPLVSVASTNGAWGGTIVTFEPDKSGCYDCFLRHVEDNSIKLPPQSKAEKVQPVGCAEPTYLAANFDAGEVALAGVRTAVSILSGGAQGGYPDLPRGVAVLSLREDDGSAIYPSWKHYSLLLHDKCKQKH